MHVVIRSTRLPSLTKLRRFVRMVSSGKGIPRDNACINNRKFAFDARVVYTSGGRTNHQLNPYRLSLFLAIQPPLHSYWTYGAPRCQHIGFK